MLTMKKIILSAFILISFFAFPLLSHASYIIHLKGGGQFITSKYWEEDGQIKFFVSGGMMGIDKDTVRKIEKSKTKPEDVYETKKPALPPVTAEKKPAAAVNAPGKEDDSKKDPVIMKEFEQLQKSFAERKNMTINELKDLRNNLTALRDKIVSNHKKDDFREEVDNISYMIYLTNDYIIEKSTGG
jgi:hypothetical protein